MAKISVEIDSESHADRLGFRTLASSNNLGILSSVALTNIMFRSMKSGYGAPHKGERHDVVRGNAKARLKSLIQDDSCDVIATIGGLFINDKSTGATKPFVSLVGRATALVTNCYGGVTLETPTLNRARWNFLRVLPTPIAAANIYLYRDGMNDNGEPMGLPAFEKSDWLSYASAVRFNEGDFVK